MDKEKGYTYWHTTLIPEVYVIVRGRAGELKEWCHVCNLSIGRWNHRVPADWSLKPYSDLAMLLLFGEVR